MFLRYTNVLHVGYSCIPDRSRNANKRSKTGCRLENEFQIVLIAVFWHAPLCEIDLVRKLYRPSSLMVSNTKILTSRVALLEYNMARVSEYKY